MKFECGDLERALAVSELMPEAREHLKDCPACRREYRIWNELSTAAKGLREEWDSPLLWPAIRRSLEAERERMRAAKAKENSLARWAARLIPFAFSAASFETGEEKLKPKPKPWTKWNIQKWNKRWMLSGAIAAALFLAAGLLLWTQLSRPAIKPPAQTQTAALSGDRDFLTEQALAEVEKNEAAYRQSIGKLSALAEPRLHQAASPVAVSYREKLLMLDSAISDTRSNLDHNRFNVRLRMDLADLYREKQQTLKELLTGDHKN